MAKTAKARKNSDRNPRSRAAKRATSPSIDTDKSLKDTTRASDATAMLASRQYGGVIKPKKKAKPLKKGQRARQERGLARAETVMDQMARKVEGAQSRTKRRRDRRALWEDVNDASKEEKRKAPKFQVLADDLNGTEDDWEDVPQPFEGDTEMKVVDGVQVPASAAGSKLVIVDRTASTTASDAEDFDGIT